jgi:3-oxoacyl-[acyl-carrier-protein] synthase-3
MAANISQAKQSNLKVMTGTVFIHGMGHSHPENIIDNKFLEELDIGTSDNWIMERVGIRTRRTVLPLDYIVETRNRDPRQAVLVAQQSNAETGKRAAEMALKTAGVTTDEIGMVIAGGCSPDTVTPAEACCIAAALGIESESFDLNSACSSFGAHLHFLARMRPEALPEFVLLVSPENNTRTINYDDRNSAVLWGDGTSAAVVSVRVPSRAQAVFHTLRSSPQGWDKVLIPRYGHFTQEGATVQTFAIKRTVKCFREIEARYAEAQKPVYLIAHQANLRMLESVCERCGIPVEQHLFNVDTYGNTGAAGAPTVLSQNWHKFKDGDVLALIVVGAGLTWSSMAIEFGDRSEQMPTNNGLINLCN